MPLPVVAFVISALVVAVLVTYFAWDDVRTDRNEAMRTNQVYSTRITSLLDSLFHKTDIMEAMIIADGGELTEKTFTDLARSLSEGSGVRAIQYLPDGIVRYVYPFEGNEPTLGSNIFENPARRDDALLALETKQITLSGPYVLNQGGFGLVARNPIFLTDANGQETFWGFTVIVLDLPAALDPILFSDLEEKGYRFELYTKGEDGAHLTIASSGALPENDPVTYTVPVPNHDWTLSVAPDAGWVDWGKVVATGAVGLLVSLLLGVVVWQMQVKRRFLHELATTDELTNLHNRRWFAEEVGRWCAGPREVPFSLFYLDLDGFKAVNDTLGHKQGDELLVQVADRFRSVCGEAGILARVGGDEFVAAVSGLVGDDAREFANRLQRALEEPFALEDCRWTIGASVGLAAYPADGSDYDELIRVADASMYAAKRTAKEKSPVK